MKKTLQLLICVVVIVFFTVLSVVVEGAAAKSRRIGICFTAEGPGDLSFNNMLYRGSIEVQGAHEVTFSYATAASNEEKDFIAALENLVKHQNSELIITLGFQAKSALDRVAERYPDRHFVLFDLSAEARPNISSVIYAQHEGAFVAGALAAMMTESKKVGFIGGVDIDILKAFVKGFEEGIDHIDSSVELLVEYCSLLPDFSGFSTPIKGHAIAQNMFTQGVDIVFGGAGGSGPGIIQAAAEQKKYAIGTDSNQDYMAPGFVLTSVMKRLDRSMIDICRKFLADELEGETTYEYGYHNGGISLTPMEFTKENIPPEVLDRIRTIEQQIIDGEIVVTNILSNAE